MSQTNVQNVEQNVLGDLFPELTAGTATGDFNKAPRFGMAPIEADILSSSTVETTTVAASSSTTETTTIAPVETVDDPDILGTGIQKSATTGSEIKDLSSYYEERIKNGKFVAIEEEVDGKKSLFIPKTAEEYDEVLDLQINFRVEEAKKELEEKWYESKSPAWKAVSQYAELVDDPTELIPFLQGVRNITSVASLDENEAEGAEQIVRARLTQAGDPSEIIEKQIESLKTTGNLIPTAKQYKPMMLQQEQQRLASEMKQKQEEERRYRQIISEIRDNAIKSIETPIFGKNKLKQEEKAAIYDMIAEPSEVNQGYGIFNAIDELFEKKDFDKLKEVALLLTNRDAFMTYLGTNVANQTAANLERKLRLAADSHGSSGKDSIQDDQQPRVNRNQYKKPSFGRGN